MPKQEKTQKRRCKHSVRRQSRGLMAAGADEALPVAIKHRRAAGEELFGRFRDVYNSVDIALGAGV
jgi:hypothetical protein